MNDALTPVIQIIEAEMESVTSSLWNTARELDGIPADDPAVELALYKLRSEIPLSVEIGRFDRNNTLISTTRYLDPWWVPGVTKSRLNYPVDVLEAAGSSCMVSDFYQYQDGDRGLMIITPVYDANGEYDGVLRLSYDIDSLFSGLTEYLKNEYGYTLWAMHTTSLMFYDENAAEIGKYLTDDPSFQTPELQNMVNTVLTNESGNISYHFYDTSRVEETQINAVWNTAFIGPEKEWRVVLTDNVPESAGTGGSNVSVEELKSFVENAYVYATKVGKTAALAAFNDPDGEYIDGELYIFAYDMNGTVLALPHQPDLIGENRWYLQDTTGIKYIQRTVARANLGGGFVMSLYENPANNFVSEMKLSYVMAIDDTWFIGSGIYLEDQPFSNTSYIDWQKREELVSQVRGMDYLTIIEGIPAVTDLINDPNSDLNGQGGLYPFAVSENGTILAYSMDPSLVGTNQLSMSNSYGMSIIREGISLSQEGGGLMYSKVWDPKTMQETYVLIYMEPADDSTYFGSMLVID
ncbi:MAG: cache domain-containing protein [Methanocorpusculum sp.]|uniref:cache domain-containing protein n=1 Tax=Methanocorpusculum sp. TaxID=2058474 RepID=UPI002722307B|nr:cache domain-containing protein [Methanocorpusculum sp.]MDO9522696.1 cache domain-containing protein [Methanocorpusculum sp.]